MKHYSSTKSGSKKGGTSRPTGKMNLHQSEKVRDQVKDAAGKGKK